MNEDQYETLEHWACVFLTESWRTLAELELEAQQRFGTSVTRVSRDQLRTLLRAFDRVGILETRIDVQSRPFRELFHVKS